jgi:hypothetical protein
MPFDLSSAREFKSSLPEPHQFHQVFNNQLHPEHLDKILQHTTSKPDGGLNCPYLLYCLLQLLNKMTDKNHAQIGRKCKVSQTSTLLTQSSCFHPELQKKT